MEENDEVKKMDNVRGITQQEKIILQNCCQSFYYAENLK